MDRQAWVVAAISLLGGTSTAAAEGAKKFELPPEATPYFGAALLHSTARDWSYGSRIDSASYTSQGSDNQAFGYQLSVGVDYPSFAVEATYSNFGEVAFKGQADGSGATFAAGPVRETLELAGPALHALARLPIGGDFSVVGKLGHSWVSADRTLRGSRPNGPNPPVKFTRNFSSRSGGLSYGVGLRYDAYHPFRLGLDYTLAEPELNDIKTDLGTLAVSVKYLFSEPES